VIRRLLHDLALAVRGVLALWQNLPALLDLWVLQLELKPHQPEPSYDEDDPRWPSPVCMRCSTDWPCDAWRAIEAKWGDR
jgi:hypothetical protein